MSSSHIGHSAASGSSIISHVGKLSLDDKAPSLAAQLQRSRAAAPRSSNRLGIDGFADDEDDQTRRPPIAVRDPQAQLLTVSLP